MFSHDGKLFKVMEIIGRYCFLNLLWLIFSLPIITIPASITAMLGVIKGWSEGNESSLVNAFFGHFKKYLIKSSLLGILQLVVGIVLVGDLFVMWNLEGALRIVTVPLFGILAILFLFMSFYIYPLLVEFDMSLKELVRNSFYLTVTRPASPTVILLFISVNVFICTFVRFLPILCAFSVTSFISYYIIKRTVAKVEKIAI
ncbi:YesL family protein [Fredinandcohnia humi]